LLNLWTERFIIYYYLIWSESETEGETIMPKTLTLETPLKQKLVKCPNTECARTFSKPLIATMKTKEGFKTYYACPYCLTEITKHAATHEKKTEKQEKARFSRRAEKKKGKNTEPEAKNSGCNHYLGYLKKRPKNAPIPDECLSCPKMVECLLK